MSAKALLRSSEFPFQDRDMQRRGDKHPDVRDDAEAVLAFEHFTAVEPRLAALRAEYGIGCPSEYSFSNLYLFRGVHAYRYWMAPLPHITGTTYDGVRHVLPLFDLDGADPGALAVILGEGGCFFPLPQNVIDRLDPTRFQWTALEADADYLYSAENFRTYRGDSLRKKALQMRQLLAAHRIEARPLAAQNAEDARRVVRQWMADKGKSPGEADENACDEAISLARRFDLDAHVFYADVTPIGLLMAQNFGARVAVMRFAKGLNSHRGIYQYMFHWYSTHAGSQVDWINFEQDLGLANFRQTKRSYQPTKMLAKYRVTLRP